MLTSISSKMMRRAFEKTRYRFEDISECKLNGDFGIYLHVPFCYSKCAFCPFYKEIFDECKKDQYLDALLKEISDKNLHGRAKWLYMGGGTPNTLSIPELGEVLKHIRSNVQLDSVGIELLPALLTEEYLEGLKRIGFTKTSMGVESFSKKVIKKSGRRTTSEEEIKKHIELTRALGLMVNVDMMVGLQEQDPSSFMRDVEKVASINPDQVTIYPFMVIRGINAQPSMQESLQFELIEKADSIFRDLGYSRKGIWTFSLCDDIYDSSRDELVEDYIGFGPSAFSTYGSWKVVNPELDVYLKNSENGRNKGFIAPKSKSTDDWRRFARMIYDLRFENSDGFPRNIRFFNWLLKAGGYSKNGTLTEKGRYFAHAITKTVVESLPFPIQNPYCVENYNEYIAYRKGRNGGTN